MELQLSEAAALFRENFSYIMSGYMKLSLTTKFINNFIQMYDENILENVSMTSSFHIATSNNSKVETVRDLQIISDIFHKTPTLKLISENANEHTTVDLSSFKNIKFLELQRIQASLVCGIQRLRSQLQTLVCCHSIQSLEEILEKCGSDNCNGYIWSELKEASFTNNNLKNLDGSFEYSPWLHTLDISHNNIKYGDQINSLTNLKHLKIAYNSLEKVPQFNGLICSRLQTLILKNNFIEDIEGLSTLINLYELDLSENCLVDHKSLSSLSHLVSLQTLNLQGNPLSFHPQHRNRTCSYLHKNISTVCFVLDSVVLTKNEKSLVGLLHPVTQRPQPSPVNSSLLDSVNLSSEKLRKVRNVTIQENEQEVETPSRSPDPFVAHLETKKQIEQLREQYGTSWLNQQSGQLVQDVLGLEKSAVFLSSTPISDYEADTSDNYLSSSVERETVTDPSVFVTAINETGEIETPEPVKESEIDNVSCYSEDENLDEGEECIYFTTLEGTDQEILLVVTETHISERDCTTSKQRARWHINTMISCELNDTKIQLNFDTLRRDRQKRVYILEESEAKRLLVALQGKMDVHKTENKVVLYQCMKCSYKFSKNNISLHCESFACPVCESNLIIEST